MHHVFGNVHAVVPTNKATILLRLPPKAEKDVAEGLSEAVAIARELPEVYVSSPSNGCSHDRRCAPVIFAPDNGPCPSLSSTAEKVQEDVIASIAWQMKADRKIGALKAFQGYMWKEGYANGDLKGA